MMSLLLTSLLVFVAAMSLAWWLTGRVLRYALQRELLDIPNQRSSHSTPTPRGGGLAIVIVLVITGLVASVLLPGQALILSMLTGAVLAFAMLGWLDDHRDLSARVRFLTQLLFALAVVLLLSTPDHGSRIPPVPSLLLTVAMVLWVVWMVNLYNFMDGIDGIAAVESLVLSAALAAWFAAAGDAGIMWMALALAGASIGFLGWNWSPARIFMGDVGSIALGAFFALVALIGWRLYDMPLVAFLVLYGVFLTDASITLLRRMLRRERWWQAHRSHYYQRAVQSGFSHARVSLAVLAIDIVLALLATALLTGMLSTTAAVAGALVILAVPMFLIDLRGRQAEH